MHSVEFKPRGLFSRASICIDGSKYPLYSAKRFGKCAEAFVIGGEMASIEISHGYAKIYVSGELVGE